MRMTGSLRPPALAWLFVLLALGCSDHDESSVKSAAGGPLLSGVADTTPRIEGTWPLTTTPVLNTCGSLGSLPVDTAALEIVQAGNDLAIHRMDACGSGLALVSGSITPANALTAESSRTFDLSPSCRLVVDEALASLVDDAGNHMTGTITLGLTPVADAAIDCGGGFPCQIDLSFAADKCSPRGCAATIPCPR